MTATAPSTTRTPADECPAAAPHAGLRTLVVALEQLSRAQREVSAATARALDVSRSTLAAVRILEVCGTSHVGDLAEALRVDLSVASRNVSALLEAGLIERTVPDDDRRARVVSLTPAGHDLAARAQTTIERLTVTSFADWEADDLDVAAHALARVSETVCQIANRLATDPVTAEPHRPPGRTA
ncbi:DNA-binding MarR family transcriptional regulator [Sediminihabitans luteus]|uniref:DNA-binding MarR family transcriptional regulator n=1 Tax=Sediminihabitans luteus TaxID=1138585 RepID=A0A2M9D076_9CELL|nr:MarR family transcriptional regulator [Sediminihabitans luteus]PJJ77569.1 DNA-binding MarR family transcriptional regulator [Sediminihabitans luteus]GII98468.1 MarR family transcriptional regulator [Sediminihabitans luteus]